MNYKPEIGARVRSERGVIGTVTNYPKKEKHQDKVIVLKDDENGNPMTGCNAAVLVKFKNLNSI